MKFLSKIRKWWKYLGLSNEIRYLKIKEEDFSGPSHFPTTIEAAMEMGQLFAAAGDAKLPEGYKPKSVRSATFEIAQDNLYARKSLDTKLGRQRSGQYATMAGGTPNLASINTDLLERDILSNNMHDDSILVTDHGVSYVH